MTPQSPIVASLNSAVAPFDTLAADHVLSAVSDAIATHRGAIEAICETGAADFDGVLLAKEAADLSLHHAWSPIAHLNRVASTPDLRAAHDAAEASLTEHGIWVSQNKALYEATVATRWREGAAKGWSDEQRRLRELVLRDFQLSGIALEGAARERYGAIATEMTQVTSGFANAVLDATDAWHITCHRRNQLAGVPDSDVARFRAAARAAGTRGWRIGLQAPDVQAILTYADSRALRRTVYYANVTRASDQGPHAGQFDNSERIERIMALRHEAASLLGFSTIADRSLATKMAPSPDAVETFLLELARTAKRTAAREMSLLREFAAAAFGIGVLKPWDIDYVSDAVRRQRYDFNAEALRAYFPADRVTRGAMDLISRLFDVGFREREDVPTWHKDARYHDVIDRRGVVFAGVYLDLYARAGKRGGAWMDVCRQRYRGPDGAHHPVAFLTCNFAASTGEVLPTLRHEDIITFLHEFGHVLHHILTEVDYPSIGGISGVEWDAVELPSQLMENFAWDYESLMPLSGHIATGEPLPRALFEKLKASRHFNAGLQLCRQIELALFDIRLHRDYSREQGSRAVETLTQVRKEVAVVNPPRWHRSPHAFTHVFAGGYSAGYYSYLWAELLSADAFGRFREAGGLCPQTGDALRREILSRGGTRTAAVNFEAFRGRQPDSTALLESYGLSS